MKHKITIYTVAEDGDENGTSSETFASQKEVEDWQRSVMTKAFQASEGGTYARNMKHYLNEGDIDAAWTIYEDKLKDPLTTYSFDETTLEIDIPIMGELVSALKLAKKELDKMGCDCERPRPTHCAVCAVNGAITKAKKSLKIETPILNKLVKALNDIESLPVDDDGSRTIPPGFLDEARAVLAKVEGK